MNKNLQKMKQNLPVIQSLIVETSQVGIINNWHGAQNVSLLPYRQQKINAKIAKLISYS